MTSSYEHAGADERLHRFEEIFYAMLESLFTQRRRGARAPQPKSWAETDADLHPIREVPPWQRPA